MMNECVWCGYSFTDEDKEEAVELWRSKQAEASEEGEGASFGASNVERV